MDLQSILDASDSSDDGYNRNPVATSNAASLILAASSSHSNSNNNYNKYPINDSADIEKILRESYDEDDEDDDLSERNNHVITADDILATDNVDVFSSPSDLPNHNNNSSDWDILQSILSSDDEEEEDENGVENWFRHSTPHAPTFSSETPSLPDHHTVSVENKRDRTIVTAAESLLQNNTTSTPILRGSEDFSLAEDNNKRKILKHLADDQRSEELSRRAVAYAAGQETKLLQSGRRDMVSPLRVKRRLKQKIELTARDGGATKPKLVKNNMRSSGIVENKTLDKISGSLEKHSDKSAKVVCGLPTSLAFNSKFIAIGTQLGIILVYDLFEVLRQRLGATYDEHNLTAAQRAGSITSLDISLNGEAIVAGYSSGMVVLWDTIRGIVLRAVGDSHHSPISSVRFLNELKVVTVDVSGLVNKMTFAKNMLWANYSMEPECLLDGTAGQILAMNVLAPFSTVKTQLRPEKLTPCLRRLTLLALSSERSSFAVAVEPRISVLHRWARPPDDRTLSLSNDGPGGDKFLPCLSWGWGLVAGGANKVMPILARGWGCCLQLLVASFPTLELDNDGGTIETNGDSAGEDVHMPAFGVHKEIDAEKPIVALEWLDDRSLMYLTTTNEFTLVDTVMMTLQERLDFSGLRLVYAEFALSRSAGKSDEEDDTTDFSTFQNSIRFCDDRLMVLCQSELKCLSIVGARRRVSSLEEDGEWLEALALALDHYESAVLSQEDRRRDQYGRKDLSRHPDIFRNRNDDEEWLSKLLVRYLSLAVENAPEPSSPKRLSRNPGGANELAKSHFQMLAGVCIEFCVVTRKADLLFGVVFERFQSVGYTSIFLDVLEPYVLNDKLPYIGAEAMSFFVEHCKATNDIATVERCLLHMDCSIMDFDTILSLLRRNGMYTALFYVYNSGLDDYVSPLEIVLEEVFDKADTGSTSTKRRADGVLQNQFERLGYKALLYLKSCFSGATFPRGDPILPEERRTSLKRELLAFLVQEIYGSSNRRHGNRASSSGHRSLAYPYLRLLLQVDARYTLQTLSLFLDSPEIHLPQPDLNGEWESPEGAQSTLQNIVQVLASIVRPSSGSASSPSRSTASAFLDFASRYIMNGSVTVDLDTTHLIFERISNVYTTADNPEDRRLAQKRAMDVLAALNRESYDPDLVLDIINEAGMHRAALLLHQQVASSWNSGTKDIALRSRHFQSAIDCYVEDDDEQFRTEVYAYIKKECAGVATTESSHDTSKPASLRDALYAKLPTLCRLDPLMTSSLVADLFVDDLDLVIESLAGNSEDQFRFLHAIASGTLARLDPVAGSVLMLRTEHYHVYLSQMARLHPDMVYDYLTTHDNYLSQECLALCEEHDIPDATVYLLEKTDKVGDALRLGLQTVESRMMDMKRAVRGIEVDSFINHRRHSRSAENLPSKQDTALGSLKRMLSVVLDVCERKSHAHGSKLWFTVLDRLINAKAFLRLSKEKPEHARIMSDILNNLLRVTMQRMVSSVPLPDLVQKVTTGNSGSNLGELREMLNGLLSTYGLELNVFQETATAFQLDVHQMRSQYRQLSVQGSIVRTILNQPLDLTKNDWVNVTGDSGSLLQTGARGNASFFQQENMTYTKRAELGLATTISRMRSQREIRERRRRDGGHGGNLQIRPSSENMTSEAEPVLVGARPVGALGATEHYGKFVMF